jgi:deoxyribodipyrimidine photo-lyase
MWFRRDLRLQDHPALAAAADAGRVVALFVLDDALRRPSGAPRLAFLYRSLRDLDAKLRENGGELVLRRGKPENVVPAVARDAGAASVHISADFGPYGAKRDERVAAALGEVPLVRTDSAYAVVPGRIVKSDGKPFRVFTPFYRTWLAYGWPAPADSDPARISWRRGIGGTGVPQDPRLPARLVLPDAGEPAAYAAWHRFRRDGLRRYSDDRDRPDLDRTSRLSVYLKYGAIHPRTLLADLGDQDETFRRELAWREFYAAVLHFWPDSAREYFVRSMARMPYATGTTADAHFAAWTAGRTGYPIVDAGMRQLLAEGWMHNRVRMIVASFLVKDLHIEWTRGARHFMRNLVDAELASNQHGWQWTAGTGTDAAPYFRIFNPIGQGKKFDPDGSYVRRFVPELRGLSGAAAHEPWEHPDGVPADYVERIVDHARERVRSLANYQNLRRSNGRAVDPRLSRALRANQCPD